MRIITKARLLWTAVVILVPVPVLADGYVTPWVGYNVTSKHDHGRGAFGAVAGYMGAGVFGFEADFEYTPDFFGTRREFGSNNAISAMGNFILGVPIGGTHGAGVRPFVSGGAGLMRTHHEGGALLDASRTTNAFGYNIGAGMMGFFSQHIGLRGDVRYTRSLDDTDRGSGVDVDQGRLRYWRVSAGVTFR
jgi:opacity protein-like surface antigen